MKVVGAQPDVEVGAQPDKSTARVAVSALPDGSTAATCRKALSKKALICGYLLGPSTCSVWQEPST